MPHDPQLADTLRAALAAYDVTEQKMFGGICWMLHGNMLCGVGVGDGHYFFRVGPDGLADALKRPGAEAAQMGQRVMKGYVTVDAAKARGQALQGWIARSAAFVETLPAK